MTVSRELPETAVPEKVLAVLAKALKRPPEEVLHKLDNGPIRLAKVSANDDLKILIAFLKKSGFSVRVVPLEAGVSSSSHAPADTEKTQKSGLVLPSALSPQHSDWQKGDIIEGTYEVLGSAAGGMGKVYFVFHRLWKMNLAIKTPQRSAVQNETRLLRFLREAELWVDLGVHPNIATCFYARVIGGLPRLFIEYVDGGDLEQWNEQKRLSDLRIVMDLMLQFCHGMMYAEEKGMIHRDIKPANCLIARDRTLKITDFGLVKRVDESSAGGAGPDASEDTSRPTDISVTLFEGGVTGSPWYMAPERFLEKGKDDITSDIYSFGIMLYEILLDARPFTFPKGFSLVALIKNHIRTRPVDPLSIRPDLPASLVELMLTCLEKKPQDRYQSFTEVCEAIEAVNRQLWPGRHPRPRPNVVGLKADSLNNQAVSLLDLGREAEARRLFEDAHSANPDHLEAVYNLHTLRWARGEISDWEVAHRMESLRIEVRETADYCHLLGLISLQRGDAARGVALLERACKSADHYAERWNEYGNGPRGFVSSLGLTPLSEIGSFAGHMKSVRSLAFSPSGQRAASVGEDRSIRIWDIDTGRCLKNLRTFTFVPVAGAFSPDGKLVAIGYGDAFKTLDVWDLDQGRPLSRFQGIGAHRLSFSTDSRCVVAADSDGRVLVRDVLSDKMVWDGGKLVGKVSCISFVRAAQVLALGGEDGSLTVWKVGAKEPVFKVHAHEGSISCLAVGPDGNLLLTGGTDETARLWNATSGEDLQRLLGHRGAVVGGCFTSEGDYVVTASSDGAVKVWEPSSRRCFRTIRIQDEEVTTCALSTDGRQLLTGGSKGSVRLWSVDPGWFSKDFLEPAICRPRTFKELAFIHDAFNGAVEDFHRLRQDGDHRGALRVFERIRNMPGFCWSREAMLIRNLIQSIPKQPGLKSWSFIRSLYGHSDGVLALEAGPDSLTLLSGSLDSSAAVWDVVTGRCLKRFQVGSPVTKVFRVPALKGIGTWSADRVLRIWDGDGKVVRELTGVSMPVALGCDGRIASAVSQQNRPITIDLETGKTLSERPVIQCDEFVCFSDQMDTIYTLKDRTRIQRWSVVNGRLEGAFRDLGVPITGFRPTPQDDRVIAGTEIGDVIIYLVGSYVNVTALRGHSASVRVLEASHDPCFWVTGSDDFSLRLWNIQTERCLALMEGHSSPVRSACFVPNSAMLASGGSDGALRLWGLEWEISPAS